MMIGHTNRCTPLPQAVQHDRSSVAALAARPLSPWSFLSPPLRSMLWADRSSAAVLQLLSSVCVLVRVCAFVFFRQDTQQPSKEIR